MAAIVSKADIGDVVAASNADTSLKAQYAINSTFSVHPLLFDILRALAKKCIDTVRVLGADMVEKGLVLSKQVIYSNINYHFTPS